MINWDKSLGKKFLWNFLSQSYQHKVTNPNFELVQPSDKTHENDWYLAAFKSISCPSSEQNYCSLLLSPALYSMSIFVESDHEQLRSVLNTPIHKTLPRIQGFIMFLQKYDFVVNYLSGKDKLFWALPKGQTQKF